MRAIESARCCKIGFLTWPPVQRLLSSVAGLFQCRWSRQLGQFSDLRLLNCPLGMIKTAWVATRIFYALSLRVRLCLQHKQHHLFSTVSKRSLPGRWEHYAQTPRWVLMCDIFFLDVFPVCFCLEMGASECLALPGMSLCQFWSWICW